MTDKTDGTWTITWMTIRPNGDIVVRVTGFKDGNKIGEVEASSPTLGRLMEIIAPLKPCNL